MVLEFYKSITGIHKKNIKLNTENITLILLMPL
jgi:hypothetical protein